MNEKNQLLIQGKRIQLAQAETGEATHSSEGATSASEGSENPILEHSPWQFTINGGIVALIILVLAFLATSRISRIPSKMQAAAEKIVEGLTDFVVGVIGPKGKPFVPFIGALFLYIAGSNLTGLLPLTTKIEHGKVNTYFAGPMANISMTFALSIIVFFVVQYVAFKEQGFGPRMKHLMGPVPWLAPLIFPLEVIGELIRPLSLSVRLFGNIFGEEMVMASIITLLVSVLPIWFPFPVHFPLLFLGLLTSIVQAGVFCLLTCVYLKLAVETHGHDDDFADNPDSPNDSLHHHAPARAAGAH